MHLVNEHLIEFKRFALIGNIICGRSRVTSLSVNTKMVTNANHYTSVEWLFAIDMQIANVENVQMSIT